jgi:rhodanese-related sulfurtransferase
MAFDSPEPVWTDLAPADAYALLQAHKDAQLVDVRTEAEWSFVGVPDLSPIGRDVIPLDWQRYPAMEVRSDFVSVLSAELERRGVPKDAPVMFLCRSGARSAAAAAAMSRAGYSHCINISGGFEGVADAAHHRGLISGWKASRLPWVQS